MSQPSLAFRRNQEAIYRGEIPDKYSRLIPYIRGKHILELGAAEGVLGLFLAEKGKHVICVERDRKRYEAALILKKHWKRTRGLKGTCTMVLGDLSERLDLLDKIDTVVGIRVIYYFSEAERYRVFLNIAKRGCEVVLGGNAGRAESYYRRQTDKLGDRNFYASATGMKTLLEANDYRIIEYVKEEIGRKKVDPIVTGVKAATNPGAYPEKRMRKTLRPYLEGKTAGDVKIADIEQLRVVRYEQEMFSVEDALEKSRGVIEHCHVAFLRAYLAEGRRLKVKNTEYWKRLKRVSSRGSDAPEAFLKLYSSIAREGFHMDVRNPIGICDLDEIGATETTGWRWCRFNGTHRLAAAHVLGIKEVPVLRTYVRLDNG